MWYNPIITAILRSPLHRLLSKQMLLLTYTGHKSGKRYTIPVNYLRDRGLLTIVSIRDRSWWRNFRDGAPVTVRLCGKNFQATAQAIAGPGTAFTAGLTTLLKNHPRHAKYMGIALDAHGTPDPGDVMQSVKYVLVELSLQSTCSNHAGTQTEATSYVHEHS